MRIVAFLAFRNEAAYLANALRHLVTNDIPFVLIDNSSEDGSSEIAQHPDFATHLLNLVNLPYDGVFDLRRQLAVKQELITAIDADWIIHLDADEIMHSYSDGESLHDTIVRLDGRGANVINFTSSILMNSSFSRSKKPIR